MLYDLRMVEESGGEKIVRMDREQIRLYYIIGWGMILISAIYACAGLSGWLFDAPGPLWSGWRGRLGALLIPLILTILAVKLFRTAQRCSQVFVAIGPDGVRLRLMQAKFDFSKPLTTTPNYQVLFIPVPKLLPEERFSWDEIGGIKKEEDGTCIFHARDRLYKLKDGNCPPPFVVAQLLAEGMGIQLPLTPAERKASLKKPMPRLKQAAILGGIGLILLVPPVAGAGWVFVYDHELSHFEEYVGAFIALLAIGVLGGTLFLTAILVLLMELNHRL